MTPDEQREALKAALRTVGHLEYNNGKDQPPEWHVYLDDAAAVLAPLITHMVADAEQRVRAEYENAISWDTTCFNCAKLLDQSYGEWAAGHEAGRAEVSAAVEAVLDERESLDREGRDAYVASLLGNRAVALIETPTVRAVLTDPAAAVARLKAEAWDEAVRECHDLGWIHDYALSDVLARNPYRADRIGSGQ